MVTYEITATVRSELAAAYESYMRDRHIPELLETGCFVAASLGRSAAGQYRIRYEARDRESLDRYLAEHAPRLRQHATEMFPEGMQIAREEWTVLEHWTSE